MSPQKNGLTQTRLHIKYACFMMLGRLVRYGWYGSAGMVGYGAADGSLLGWDHVKALSYRCIRSTRTASTRRSTII
ncbi:hypothetical protein BpHYR1_003223 [Brachionus plicatilis]|uniref:Uncharacterized protein n=1 Tax=Brachionus plicatilis TaxID=10195 RepID=A0A3M7RX25_BRAPC|nr:hypothetical protein BpHYR1_003223 [Brachionus plicatilis]